MNFSQNIIAVPIELASGSNTIRFNKAKNYAEIDYIDLVYIKGATIETSNTNT